MTRAEFYDGLRWLIVLAMLVMLVWLVMAVPDEGVLNPPDLVSLLMKEGK